MSLQNSDIGRRSVDVSTTTNATNALSIVFILDPGLLML